ncbi:MBL fold hydrolase [Vagococcus lutrae]|uniref:MBL fold hydrolase n=1 Tax=Vagococcus lutrae TaxID=81947 RepID=A0AAE9XE76_9ENTE|nr:MBL fold hydrolase [Vagococcus lutrae]WCG22689.1 MBL fold hydrolase [Vagococcus lutrae]
MKRKKWLVGLALVIAVGLVGCQAKKETKEKTTKTKETQVRPKIEKVIKGETFTYHVMKPDEVFGATAVLVEKNGKGLLVDTQFSKENAEDIVAYIKEKQITLDTLYISYSDPDFYFGTAVIKEAFPDAKVLATASTIKRIKETNEAKQAVWQETLQDNAPDRILLPELAPSALTLDSDTLQIVGSDEEKQTLYQPTDKILLGGILVAADSHLFMADTKTRESQEQWLKDLEELTTFGATRVIPNHFASGNDFSPENIAFTKEYLERFMLSEATYTTSEEIIQDMKAAYPNLPDDSLEMSAKVVTGEMDWE